MARALPQPGEIIAGKYLVTGLIGRGGMGAVYVVEHRVTRKRLAVKCLLPEHSEQPELVERFLREAQAAGRIQHRYVVDVFDVGQDDGLLYIVMELIDGKQLGDVLRDARLPAEDLLLVLSRAMEGVAAAHAQGIVHRDLKPENILVCRGPSGKLDDPRVLDFGISKLQEEDARSPLTKSGMMMGTPYYMSFEQINCQRDLDQRVDVYAMGVIIYEALTGRVPYQAESVGALAIRMMSGPPEPLAELRPDLTPALVEVVMRAIARDRDERYSSMHALIEALAPFVREELSLTPARGSLRLDDDAKPSTSLRQSVGGAKTLRSTPTGRSDSKLRVDEDDESARPTTGAHDFPLGKVLFAAVGVLVVALALVLWRQSAAHVSEVPGVPAPPEVGARVEPEGPVPASAEPLKRVEAVLADASPGAAESAGAVLEAAQPEPEPAEEAPGPAAKAGKKKPLKRGKRGEPLSLDQMVPKAPELPPEEREPAAAPAAPPAVREEPPPAPPAPAPEPPPAAP
jgi:eukaryotic-like serine/threonine-protein kinase